MSAPERAAPRAEPATRPRIGGRRLPTIVMRLSLAGLLSAMSPGAAGARGHGTSASPVRHRAEFPLAGIVGLAGDRILLWSSAGQMQIGTAAGVWTEVFRVAGSWPGRPGA